MSFKIISGTKVFGKMSDPVRRCYRLMQQPNFVPEKERSIYNKCQPPSPEIVHQLNYLCL